MICFGKTSRAWIGVSVREGVDGWLRLLLKACGEAHEVMQWRRIKLLADKTRVCLYNVRPAASSHTTLGSNESWVQHTR